MKTFLSLLFLTTVVATNHTADTKNLLPETPRTDPHKALEPSVTVPPLNLDPVYQQDSQPATRPTTPHSRNNLFEKEKGSQKYIPSCRRDRPMPSTQPSTPKESSGQCQPRRNQQGYLSNPILRVTLFRYYLQPRFSEQAIQRLSAAMAEADFANRL